MKVKLLCSRAGPGIYNDRGDVITVSDEDGKRLIEKDYAEVVKEMPELAAVGGGETATRKRGRPRKRT